MSPELERIVAHVRKVAANEGGIRCGVCARAVVGLASVCTQCETPAHSDCWDYNGGCAIFGCASAPKPPVQLDLADLKPRPRPWTRVAALATLALVTGAVMWVYLVQFKPHEPAPAPARCKPGVSGNFTVRLGSTPAPDGTTTELAMLTQILVVTADAARALRLGDGAVPHALTGDPGAFAATLAAEVLAGRARVVASPRLMASQGRDTIVRVGRRLMFTGRPEADREPGSIQVRYRAETVTKVGMTLAIGSGDAPEQKTQAAWDRPVLALRVPQTDPGAGAFFERWKLAGHDDLEAVVVLVPALR